MKKLFFVLSVFACLNAAAQTKADQDANATVRPINGNFTEVNVATGVDLYLTQGNEVSLSVSVSDPIFADKFKTEVVNGVLKIYYDNKGVTWKNDKKRKLKAYLSLKTLEKLTVSSGAYVVTNNPLEVNNFKMRLSSGSKFSGTIKTLSLDVAQDSGSLVDISGSADNLKVDVSSGAAFKGYNFISENCVAKASSGADIKISINKELDASASSGAGIKYKGNGEVKNLKVSSGGSVKKS